MKNVMKRAWEIYRTLAGDRVAKLSQALKMAWAEVKAAAKTVTYTLAEAVTKAFESIGYEVEYHKVDCCVVAKKVITVKYYDYKHDDKYADMKQVYGSYNKESKTIDLVNRVIYCCCEDTNNKTTFSEINVNEILDYVRNDYHEGVIIA